MLTTLLFALMADHTPEHTAEQTKDKPVETSHHHKGYGHKNTNKATHDLIKGELEKLHIPSTCEEERSMEGDQQKPKKHKGKKKHHEEVGEKTEKHHHKGKKRHHEEDVAKTATSEEETSVEPVTKKAKAEDSTEAKDTMQPEKTEKMPSEPKMEEVKEAGAKKDETEITEKK